MDLNITALVIPVATGFCAWFGTTVGLKTDVQWLKEGQKQLKETVGKLGERVSTLEGSNK